MPSGYYVIRFNGTDWRRIKGIARDEQTLYLRHEEFEEVPISFLTLYSAGIMYQYWTLRKRLHRTDGPAYVHYHPVHKILQHGYYRYGFTHREDGPARENYRDYEVDVDSFSNHVFESWSGSEFEWYIDGQLTPGYPASAQIKEGRRYKTKRTDIMDSPEGFTPTFFADQLHISYHHPYSHTSKGGLLPDMLTFIEFSEDYKKGELQERYCSEVNSFWIKHGEADNTPNKFDEAFQRRLIKYINIWHGPFYKDAESEFIFLTEYEANAGGNNQ